MTINRFEYLIAWQKARQFVAAVYGATTKGAFAKDYGLRDQIQRSAVSIMSNIAEGFDRGSRPEFHKFLVIAKGPCAEARSQLYVALDCGYISQQDFDIIVALAQELAKIIGGLRASVQRQRDAAAQS